MAWVAITEADVLTVLSGPELAAYRSVALAGGQADPVAPIIGQVVDLVRGYVGGCTSNQLGEAGTIPAKLLQPALDIIAVRIPRRVRKDPTQARQDAHDQAIALLEKVSNCDFDIEEPVTPSTEETAAGTPRISGGKRKFGREQQDGI